MRFAICTTLLLALLHLLPGPAPAAETAEFIKLDGAGRELPDQAENWLMVLDRSTGLIWEIKTTDGSIHDRDNTYTWKNTTATFIKGLNAEQFGGFSDWRLPEDEELVRLLKLAEHNPELFARYFPRTAPSVYWTWSRCQDGSPNSARMKFGPEPSPQERQHRIRAVHGKMRE